MMVLSSLCSILLFHTKRLLRGTSGSGWAGRDQSSLEHGVVQKVRKYLKEIEVILKGLSAVK